MHAKGVNVVAGTPPLHGGKRKPWISGRPLDTPSERTWGVPEGQEASLEDKLGGSSKSPGQGG